MGAHLHCNRKKERAKNLRMRRRRRSRRSPVTCDAGCGGSSFALQVMDVDELERERMLMSQICVCTIVMQPEKRMVYVNKVENMYVCMIEKAKKRTVYLNELLYLMTMEAKRSDAMKVLRQENKVIANKKKTPAWFYSFIFITTH